MTCPGNFTFARYLASPMREVERATIENHLVGCSECRGKLADYVKNHRDMAAVSLEAREQGRALDARFDSEPAATPTKRARVIPPRTSRMDGEAADRAYAERKDSL